MCLYSSVSVVQINLFTSSHNILCLVPSNVIKSTLISDKKSVRVAYFPAKLKSLDGYKQEPVVTTVVKP